MNKNFLLSRQNPWSRPWLQVAQTEKQRESKNIESIMAMCGTLNLQHSNSENGLNSEVINILWPVIKFVK